MGVFCSLLLLSVAALPAHAQMIDLTSTGSQLTETGSTEITEEQTVVVPAPAVTVDWVDVGKVVDQLRIPEKMADLRAVTVDPDGKNYGFYFASTGKGSFAVYRNGRRMQRGTTESVADLQKPVLFRMTASGDLLYALHGTDLYVNSAAVSLDLYPFSTGAGSVHDEGGILTFPEGGQVVTYDIARGVRRVLYKHNGSIQYLRRSGKTIAYTLFERGFVRMYRDGRRVSTKDVENPANFAVAPNGDVYFFTKASRGYALYRNVRSYIAGPGNGAYVDVDPAGHVWHMSYVVRNGVTSVALKKDRTARNLLPPAVANVELSLGFINDGYALRGSFAEDPSTFFLIRDGEEMGESFLFEWPLNDTHGFSYVDDSVVLRGYDGARWRIYVDGDPLAHATLRTAWFARVRDGKLTVYATK